MSEQLSDSPGMHSQKHKESKGTLLGTPNREPQEYNRNIRTQVGIFLLYSFYIPGVPCLGFPIKSNPKP